jgi:hypothetical protein
MTTNSAHVRWGERGAPVQFLLGGLGERLRVNRKGIGDAEPVHLRGMKSC